MAKPKFYLEPRPTPNNAQAINMFYSFAGQRLQYYTGVRIDVNYYRKECNDSNTIPPIKTTAPNATIFNQRLKNIATDAIKIVNEAKGKNLNIKYVTAQLDLIYKPKQAEPEPEKPFEHNFISFFEQLLKDTQSGKRLISQGKNVGKKYTLNSIKNYSTALVAVKRYLDFEGIKLLPLNEVNKDFYESFRNFCYDVEKKEVSTFAGYVKRIKSVMFESGTTTFKIKEFQTPFYEADTIYLTLAEIDKLANLDLKDGTKNITRHLNNKAEQISYTTLNKTRDIFLIGAYSGLRFCDINALEPQSIDGNFIKVKQIKTGGRITIPIMSRLRPILDKYPNELPTLSNQKFNDYIKEVGKLAGLTEMRTVKNFKGNTYNETQSPLYALITSHCCRRSYATNMFKAGVPPMLIMSATGHKTETSFLKYIRANNEDKANLLAETLTKLGL